MRLIGDFMELVATSKTEQGFSATIQLNADHIIFKGHFPGYPVTPGVIQLQIVHELLETHFNGSYKLVQLLHCKFLRVLNPLETPRLTIFIRYAEQENQLRVDAMGQLNDETYFKLKSIYREEGK